MKGVRKILAALLVLFCVASLVSCQMGETDETGPRPANIVAAEERTTVRVALIAGETAIDEGIFFEINNSGDYEYRAESYSAKDIGRFMKELSAGQAPDLVLFYDNVNTESGYFEDLYSYIDRDPELKRKSFLPNFLEALSSGGELHQIWDRTELMSLLARTADVGDGYGLTPEDYSRMAAENGGYAAVFHNFLGRNGLLTQVAKLGMMAYVDREKGNCDFLNSTFKDLLAWTKDMGGEAIENQDGVDASVQLALLMPGRVRRIEDAEAVSSTFGEPAVFVGFPNGGEGLSYYLPSLDGGISMAIPKTSRNKDGAWAFIKYRLSMERQLAGNGQGIPVLYEAAKRLAAEELDEAARDALEGLLNKTRYAETYADRELRELIVSCGQDYLDGNSTIAQAVNAIQSRAQVYLSKR